MKKHPIIFKLIGIFLLLAPTIVYLCFLVPVLKEEYNVLMASGGIIGGSGYYGISKIPETFTNSKLFKLSSSVFTTLIVITIVSEFIKELVLLVFIMMISYILYKIFSELYLKYRRKKENEELAREITSSVINSIK